MPLANSAGCRCRSFSFGHFIFVSHDKLGEAVVAKQRDTFKELSSDVLNF